MEIFEMPKTVNAFWMLRGSNSCDKTFASCYRFSSARLSEHEHRFNLISKSRAKSSQSNSSVTS